MAQLLAAGAFAGLALLSWRERQGKQSDNKPVSKTYEVRISMWRAQSCRGQRCTGYGWAIGAWAAGPATDGAKHGRKQRPSCLDRSGHAPVIGPCPPT